ncbi:hypothetical protein L1987_22806 [Smallanthus sonchifolius]|uniref:Uncharacterized protein n=1 Tax=Smallanthus sonchifolius TaxID=185202 RepID=A0ACB9IF56_9ASTR|nr:hypothetical protein L1987_22806 [Smallanthus sonchifolius]
MHRYHHQYVDSEKDPHSPTFGFWFSHMGWLFDSGYTLEKYQERKNVEDLKNQVFYKFIQRSYLLHIFAFPALVYAFGGFTYLVWVVRCSRDFNKNRLDDGDNWGAPFRIPGEEEGDPDLSLVFSKKKSYPR